jgi:hypothetical protein
MAVLPLLLILPPLILFYVLDVKIALVLLYITPLPVLVVVSAAAIWG